jgi:hypothetical protein
MYCKEKHLSTEITKKILREFLTNEMHDVLALTGAWGVGKTYFWNKALKENKSGVKLSKYCYVSLFGIGSMAELRMALLLKSVSLGSIDQSLDLATINKEWARISKDFFVKGFSKLSPLLKSIPHGATVSLGLETFATNLVRDTLFCFDDFERQTSLKPEDILGLINELKEEKGCKIALIFNDEHLRSAEVYHTYKEKVIDLEVHYKPTVAEAYDLVFQRDFPHHERIRSYVVDLDITNVRILRKIHRLISVVLAAIRGMHENVIEASIASSVLLGWCVYSASPDKPNIDEIESWNEELFGFKKNDDEKDPAAPWVVRLKAYGFNHVDDLDLALAKVVTLGYVDGTGFVEAASKRDLELRNADMSAPLSKVWRKFHDSFDGTSEEFIAELYDATLHGIAHIGVSDLNSSVRMLRNLERSDLADDLIERFINEHSAQINIFDLNEHPFGGSIDDAVLRAKFETLHSVLVELPGLEESLVFMVKHSAYNPEHILALRNATVDEYQALFLKEHRDVRLANIIKWCLRWDGENAEITNKSREALARIKHTGLLNEIRVSRFGV